MAYVPPTTTGYNDTPPPDDGSRVPANIFSWATIKSKLADPLQTLVNAVIARPKSRVLFSESTTSFLSGTSGGRFNATFTTFTPADAGSALLVDVAFDAIIDIDAASFDGKVSVSLIFDIPAQPVEAFAEANVTIGVTDFGPKTERSAATTMSGHIMHTINNWSTLGPGVETTLTLGLEITDLSADVVIDHAQIRVIEVDA